MVVPSYLALLRREIHAVRDMFSRLEGSEPDDAVLRAVRERLGVAIQYAAGVNRRHAMVLEEARRALWSASRSRTPTAHVDRASSLVAEVVEDMRQDVRD